MTPKRYNLLVKTAKIINDFTNLAIFGFFTVFTYAFPEATILLIPLFIMTFNIFIMINSYINSCTITYSIYSQMCVLTYIIMTLYVYSINSMFGFHIKSHAISFILQMNIPTMINMIVVMIIDYKIKDTVLEKLGRINSE